MRSHTLSGCPSDTDSLVKTKFCLTKVYSPYHRAGARHQPAADGPRLRSHAPVHGGPLSNVAPHASSTMLPASALYAPPRMPFWQIFALRRQSPGELEKAPPQRRIRDRIVRFDQFDRFAFAQGIGVEHLRRWLGKAAGHCRGPNRIGGVVKK